VCIAVAALVAAIGAVWWSIQAEREARRSPEPSEDRPIPLSPPRRRPAFEPWMVAAAVVVIAGLVFVPRLFGATFLFLPFLFGGRRRRMPRQDRPDDDPRWSSSD
jgi:hypothetical protein